MSRYTDYDAIDYKNYNMIGKSQEFMRGVVYMAERIEEAPSIGICFCRECKYKEFCEKKIHRHGIAYSIDFCSYGEREGE